MSSALRITTSYEWDKIRQRTYRFPNGNGTDSQRRHNPLNLFCIQLQNTIQNSELLVTQRLLPSAMEL